MPQASDFRRLFRPATRWAALCMGLLAGATATAAPAPGCDIHWQLSPQREAVPPQILVTLTLDAGNRSRTELQLPEGSELALITGDGGPNLDAVPGRPGNRSVAHKPGERVALRFAVMPGPDAWLRLAPGSLIFAAPALLPVPVDAAGRGSAAMCISIDGLAESDQVVANQGQQTSGATVNERVLRLQGPQALARDWVVAAGALQQADRRSDGLNLHVVMAAATPMGFDANTLADAAARQAGMVRRFWSDGDAPEQWLVLLPAQANQPPRGLAMRQVQLLQAPTTMALPGSEIDSLLLQTTLQAWFRERFGPVAYDQRPDDPMTQWFTLGFANFYALRLQVGATQPGAPASATQPALQAQADTLTSYLQPRPGATNASPWLAMRWHTELRDQGHSGLDAVLKRQQLSAAQARPTGPLSSPLATHKLQAALRHVLADAPRNDLQELVERVGPNGLTPQMIGPQTLGPQTLGPCFRFDKEAQRVRPASDGEPGAACQAWLGGAAPVRVAAVALAGDAGNSVTSAKAGKAGKGKSKASATAKSGKGKASGKSSGKAASKAGSKASNKGGSKKSSKHASR